MIPPHSLAAWNESRHYFHCDCGKTFASKRAHTSHQTIMRKRESKQARK